MYDATHLWWPAFGPLYDDLSHPMKTSIEDVGRVLQANRHKLLCVLSFFQTPQSRTTEVIVENCSFELDPHLNVDHRRLNDPDLCELALQASNYLNLDAVQSYFLILHYQDSHGTAQKGRRSDVSMSELQAFYFKERLHLLKCLELMIQDGEASPFWSVTVTMVDENLDAQVANNIAENLQFSYMELNDLPSKAPMATEADAGPFPGAKQANKVACMIEAARELGNLLDILLAIWDDPTLFCPCGIWLKLADAFDRYLFPLENKHPNTELERTIPRAQDLGALVLVQGLHLEDILQQMYSTEPAAEGDSLFGRPPPSEPSGPSSSGQSDGAGGTRRSRRPSKPSMSNVWKPSTPRALTPHAASSNEAFTVEERMMISELLEGWCSRETVHMLQVPALLGWSAFLILHDSVSFDIYSDPAETWNRIEAFAAKAWESGGFASLLHLAKADGLRVDYNLASVYKSIQMNLGVASLAAFGISPLTLAPDDLDAMLQTTYHLFSDQPELCTMFWDVNTLAKEPMFHFLNVARDIFPAVPMPLLYLLAAVCNGPQNATQVHTYLARLPSLTFRHAMDDPDLSIDSTAAGGRAVATASKPIKEIPMLSIPVGTEGSVVHCLTDQQLSELGDSTKLLRRLTSSMQTPNSVRRTVSLSGFNAIGLPSPDVSRRTSNADNRSTDEILLEFREPSTSSPRLGSNGAAAGGSDGKTSSTPDGGSKVGGRLGIEQPSSPFLTTAVHDGHTESAFATPSSTKVNRTLSILTDVDSEEAMNNPSDILIKWQVEPPRGCGVVKVLLQVGVLSRSLRHGATSIEVLGDLKVILRLLANMSMADSSTGKELLKYEVQDMSSSASLRELSFKAQTPQPQPGGTRRRTTLLSLVCRVLDDCMRLDEPALEHMGLCLSICASLAIHAPGEVVQQLMNTQLLESFHSIPLTVDAAILENSSSILQRMQGSITKGLPRFRAIHEQYEMSEHTFPVTEGLLEVMAVVLHKGVTSGIVAEAFGWLMIRVLSQHASWTYSKPAQQYNLAELCLRVIRRGTQTVMSAARHARSNEEVDHRIAFVEALESFISRSLLCFLPSAFPPPATTLEQDRVNSSDLVVTKSRENLAKEMLALLPALDQRQDIQERLFFDRQGSEPCGAACLSSYLTYSHSDLKMRLLALNAIKVFLEVISGQQPSSSMRKLSYTDLLISEGMRGAEGNQALWRNTLVQSTGLVMAGIDTSVCCAAMECVKWTISNQSHLMNVLLFPTLLDKKGESTMGQIMPWTRKQKQQQQEGNGHPEAPPTRSDDSAVNIEELNGGAELQPLSGSATAQQNGNAAGGAHPVAVSGPSASGASTTSAGARPASEQRGPGAQPSPGPSSAAMSTSTLSVLDCLWDLLQDAPRLLKEKPQSISAALQVLAVLLQSSQMSAKHREAADILKRQPGFWTCVASCVPARQTQESDHEPERSQHLAERSALLCMAIELTHYLKAPNGFMRNNTHKELLNVVRSWEREGWRGRAARINQLLMERDGTNIQEVGNASTGITSMCTASRSCMCLGMIVMMLIVIIIVQRQS